MPLSNGGTWNILAASFHDCILWHVSLPQHYLSPRMPTGLMISLWNWHWLRQFRYWPTLGIFLQPSPSSPSFSWPIQAAAELLKHGDRVSLPIPPLLRCECNCPFPGSSCFRCCRNLWNLWRQGGPPFLAPRPVAGTGSYMLSSRSTGIISAILARSKSACGLRLS